MTEPGAPRPESFEITDEEVISGFINASTHGETLESPGPLFESARAKFTAWVAQEHIRLVQGSIDFDVRRITILARGGMKEYAAGELGDLDMQIGFDGSLDLTEKTRLRGELERLRLGLAL